MRAKELDYLLMEGTAFWPPRSDDSNDDKFIQVPEGKVGDVISEKISAVKGLTFFNFYHRNLERMENLIQAASDSGREIVFESDTAQLVQAFFPDAKYKILGHSISAAEINKIPGKYFVQNNFVNILSLIDYAAEDSLYIHTNGVPLGAFDPAFTSMVSFLATLGIAFESVSSSGHGDVSAILEIIDGIKPKVLIPWHSTTPEQMIPLDKLQEVLLPEVGTWY